MSETKHTPGPWVSSKFGFQVLTGDSWSTVCALKGDASWENNRGDYHQEYEWQRQEANARLIAAAPELLAVVQMVAKASMFETRPHRGESSIGWQSDAKLNGSDVWKAAHAAIAKATGADQ